MATSGCLPANIYQGARSEYLAQYVLSAFGSSQMVARTEDYGLDFYCSLGERIGQRLHVENFYNVQVKSNEANFSYEDEKSVEWLFSLKTPILYCVVDKSTHTIKIYSGFGITLLSSKSNLTKIDIEFGGSSHDKDIEYKGESTATVKLKIPILEFNVLELESREFVHNAKNVLKFWIECDQLNIDRKHIGLSTFGYPLEIETNKVPPKDLGQVSGNILETFKNESSLNKQMANLYRALTFQIGFAAHAGDSNYLISLAHAAVDTIRRDYAMDDLEASERKVDIISLAGHIKSAYLLFNLQLPEFIEDNFSDVDVENIIVRSKKSI